MLGRRKHIRFGDVKKEKMKANEIAKEDVFPFCLALKLCLYFKQRDFSNFSTTEGELLFPPARLIGPWSNVVKNKSKSISAEWPVFVNQTE